MKVASDLIFRILTYIQVIIEKERFRAGTWLYPSVVDRMEADWNLKLQMIGAEFKRTK